jgi:predicted transcriptional regulator
MVLARVPESDVAAMDAIVRADERSRSWFIRHAIAEKLERDATRPAEQDEVERDAVPA